MFSQGPLTVRAAVAAQGDIRIAYALLYIFEVAPPALEMLSAQRRSRRSRPGISPTRDIGIPHPRSGQPEGAPRGNRPGEHEVGRRRRYLRGTTGGRRLDPACSGSAASTAAVGVGQRSCRIDLTVHRDAVSRNLK